MIEPRVDENELIESLHKYRGEPNPLAAALFELVDCKVLADWLDRNEQKDLSGPRNYAAEERREEYNRRKPLAWKEARRALIEFFSGALSSTTLTDCECPQEGICLGMVNPGQRCVVSATTLPADILELAKAWVDSADNHERDGEPPPDQWSDQSQDALKLARHILADAQFRPDWANYKQGCADGHAEGREVTEDMVNRFLQWPVPASVYPDGIPGKPGRTGTNLLSAIEAKAMLEHVLAPSDRTAGT